MEVAELARFDQGKATRAVGLKGARKEAAELVKLNDAEGARRAQVQAPPDDQPRRDRELARLDAAETARAEAVKAHADAQLDRRKQLAELDAAFRAHGAAVKARSRMLKEAEDKDEGLVYYRKKVSP